MRRRSFLTSAASLAPVLAMRSALAAEEPAPAPRIVGAGQDCFNQPHPTGFSSLLFKLPGADTGDRVFLIEHKDLLPGGPPLHRHLYQDEWFFVIDGHVAFQVGDQRIELRSGESALAPRRIPHTFSSIASAPGHMLIAFSPAGKMEQYFHDNADGRHNASDPVATFAKYDMEYLGPSPFHKSA